MSSEAILHKDTNKYRFTAATTYASGEVLKDPNDGKAAVVEGLKTKASGDEVSCAKSGVFDLLCAAATTFTAGDPVYWDASANLAVDTPGDSADFFCGFAQAAVSNAQTRVRVALNEGGKLDEYMAVKSTREHELDHADTAAVTLLAAADNPNGCLVVGFVGRVTEAPAGSSEDQLVLTLRDEDENAQSVITTTDTTPDAIGDIVIGTRTLQAGSTGDVAALIPAGKAAEVIVTQATAGTPAGKVKVRMLYIPLF
jgi:predicted RecA/RadA family phage recombinase